jgi:hypothetical protein
MAFHEKILNVSLNEDKMLSTDSLATLEEIEKGMNDLYEKMKESEKGFK